MKYARFGYVDESKFEMIPENEMNAMMDECFAYDDELRRGGHFAGGEALQEAKSAVTLRYGAKGVEVTDGPYAEAREVIGGLFIVEAASYEEVVELSKDCPHLDFGTIEIREVQPT